MRLQLLQTKAKNMKNSFQLNADLINSLLLYIFSTKKSEKIILFDYKKYIEWTPSLPFPVNL